MQTIFLQSSVDVTVQRCTKMILFLRYQCILHSPALRLIFAARVTRAIIIIVDVIADQHLELRVPHCSHHNHFSKH